MNKLDLNQVAGEFEMINAETHLFYNAETGEFDFYSDFMDANEDRAEKFMEHPWIAGPKQHEIDEYDMMARFVETVTDAHANELLSVALEGRGAFRRFKDTLHRIGQSEEWYAFKRAAYIDLAREWCDDNHIPYVR